MGPGGLGSPPSCRRRAIPCFATPTFWDRDPHGGATLSRDRRSRSPATRVRPRRSPRPSPGRRPSRAQSRCAPRARAPRLERRRPPHRCAGASSPHRRRGRRWGRGHLAAADAERAQRQALEPSAGRRSPRRFATGRLGFTPAPELRCRRARMLELRRPAPRARGSHRARDGQARARRTRNADRRASRGPRPGPDGVAGRGRGRVVSPRARRRDGVCLGGAQLVGGSSLNGTTNAFRRVVVLCGCPHPLPLPARPSPCYATFSRARADTRRAKSCPARTISTCMDTQTIPRAFDGALGMRWLPRRACTELSAATRGPRKPRVFDAAQPSA